VAQARQRLFQPLHLVIDGARAIPEIIARRIRSDGSLIDGFIAHVNAPG
jgi:hypothetical protein